MALVDEPVRSFKAKMASLISAREVMMSIGKSFVAKRIFIFVISVRFMRDKKNCAVGCFFEIAI